MDNLKTKKENENSIIWQLGKFHNKEEIIDKEFMNIKTFCYRYDVPGDWAKLSTFELPKTLAGSTKLGCVRLEIEFNLEKGFYVFIRRFLEPEEPICCEVYFDNQELDVYFTASIFNEKGDLISEIQVTHHPFVCQTSGRHRITLSMERSMNEGRYVRLDALVLKHYKVKPHIHSLNTEIPAQLPLDAWGWMAGINYHRRPGQQGKEVWLPEDNPDPSYTYNQQLDTPTDLDYLKKRVIDESYKRGANFLQAFPFLIEWKSIEKGKYLSGENPDWKSDEDLKLIQYAHFRDMIMDDHGNFEGLIKKKGAQLKVNTDYLSNVPHLGSVQEKGQYRANEELDCLKDKCIRSHNLTEGHWTRTLDGYESEGVSLTESPQGMIALYNLLWQYNPGSYVSDCGSRWGTWRWLPSPKNAPWQRVRGPNFIKAIMCANEIKGLGFRSPAVGYDDKTPISPFPKHSELNNEYGKKFLGYQADSRRFTTAVCGGGSTPDWILKQCNDFFRPRYKNPDDAYESCIWWLGEPDTVCPREVKEYIYAITQNPIKCAVATTLTNTGVGGTMERRRNLFRMRALIAGQDMSRNLLWKIRKRSDFPHDTRFIQNNYLRLLLNPEEEGGVLLYDLERTAHYDSNSLSIPLTTSLITTRGENQAKVYEKEYEIPNPGGYISILKVKRRLNIDGKKLEEKISYSIITDTPYICIEVQRKAHEILPVVNTVLGCEGYDILIVNGKKNKETVSFKKKNLPSLIRLKDSSGFKEDMVLIILKLGIISQINWAPGSLSLQSINVESESLQIAIVVPTDLYSDEQIQELREFLLNSGEVTVQSGNLPLLIENKYNLPVVKIIKINQPNPHPYFVKEYGWWIFRGAQSSLSNPEVDYLSVYLPAKSKAIVQSYGFIKGAVKPGWGCQYVLAIKNISKDEKKIKCSVKVLSVTPYLFAPRLEFSKKVESVSLNGTPWYYFDESMVFLPNRKGTYEIEVSIDKEGSVPHLIRTAALIEETSWKDGIFSFKANLPVWSKKIPEGLKFVALIRLPKGCGKIREIEGGKVQRKGENSVLIRFIPPVEVKISLR